MLSLGVIITETEKTQQRVRTNLRELARLFLLQQTERTAFLVERFY